MNMEKTWILSTPGCRVNPGARSRVGQVWNGLLIVDRYRIS